jgi:DNA-directed RNA polymerase subunit RPC12/RpoP
VSEEKVTLKCSECKAKFLAKPEQVGVQATCKKCGKTATFLRDRDWNSLPVEPADASVNPSPASEWNKPASSQAPEENNAFNPGSRHNPPAALVQYEYKCVPAPKIVSVTIGDEDAAFESYAELLNNEAKKGFELDHISNISVLSSEKSGGCLMAIIRLFVPAKSHTVDYTMLVFRRPRRPGP